VWDDGAPAGYRLAVENEKEEGLSQWGEESLKKVGQWEGYHGPEFGQGAG